MILPLAAAAAALAFPSLGLSPIALDLGEWHFGGMSFHPAIRWYSLAYIAGILVGWWYLLKLVARPGSPMARRHADDMVFYATLGILIGGRLAYVLFYQPAMLAHPAEILRLWDGGMSFHGGVLGVTAGIVLMARRHGLNWLRIHDYIACCVPFGLFFGRCANFVNGELWGRETGVPWAMRFVEYANGVPFLGPPRHPSQLYEALLEGVALFAVLWFAFWRTQARYEPGKLVGLFLLGYGLCRFGLEFVREPDVQLGTLSWGLTMGQTLTLPMLAGGAWLIATARGRRRRAEAIAGGAAAA